MNPEKAQYEPVNREAVKVLAKAVGLREAARRMGINQNTVLQWSARDPDGPWAKQADASTLSTPSVTGATLQQVSNHSVIKPSQAMQNVMNGRKDKSRFLLSTFVLNASKVASRSRSPLADAQDVRHVAAVHSAIWPEERSERGLTLNVLNVAGGME